MDPLWQACHCNSWPGSNDDTCPVLLMLDNEGPPSNSLNNPSSFFRLFYFLCTEIVIVGSCWLVVVAWNVSCPGKFRRNKISGCLLKGKWITVWEHGMNTRNWREDWKCCHKFVEKSRMELWKYILRSQVFHWRYHFFKLSYFLNFDATYLIFVYCLKEMHFRFILM